MKNITCIMCPMGCSISAEIGADGQIVASGYTCKRGIDYAKNELVSPKRVVTSLVKVNDGGVLSVKTSNVIPKSEIFNVLNALKSIVADVNSKIGDVIIKNVLDLGVDIVATSNVKQ